MTVETLQSVNFPRIAIDCDLDYHAVEKELKRPGWFHDAMAEVLERMKYSLAQSIMDLAIGKGGLIGKASLPAVRDMIELLDSGVLLGGFNQNESDKNSESTLEDLRQKLGITKAPGADS